MVIDFFINLLTIKFNKEEKIYILSKTVMGKFFIIFDFHYLKKYLIKFLIYDKILYILINPTHAINVPCVGGYN